MAAKKAVAKPSVSKAAAPKMKSFDGGKGAKTFKSDLSKGKVDKIYPGGQWTTVK